MFLRTINYKNLLLFKPSRLTARLVTSSSTSSIDKINKERPLLLEHHLYEIKARNSCAGIFTKAGPYQGLPGFTIARSKMGRTYLDFEILFEAHDLYGTASAKKLIESSPTFSNSKQQLEYLLKWRDEIDPSYTADDARITQMRTKS